MVGVPDLEAVNSHPSNQGVNAAQNTATPPTDSPLHLPTGELLPGSHPADEDEPHLLLVPGLPLLTALRPPGGAVPAQWRRPPVCDGDQRHRRGHGREEQLLWGVSHQLEMVCGEDDRGARPRWQSFRRRI